MRKIQTPRHLTSILTLMFFIYGSVVLLFSSGLYFILHFWIQQEHLFTEQKLLARDAADDVENYVREKLRIMETAVTIGEPTNSSYEERRKVLENMVGMDHSFRNAVLLDSDFNELSKASRFSRNTWSDFKDRLENEMIDQCMAGNTYISSVYLDSFTNEPFLNLAIPVTNITRDVEFVLAAELNLKMMWDLMDNLDISYSGYAYVVDRQGDLIAFNDISRVFKGENLSYIEPVSWFLENESDSGQKCKATIAKGIGGETVISTCFPIGKPGWAVITEVPVKEAYSPLIHSVAISFIIFILLTAVAALLGSIISRRLSNPIIHLTETAAEITRGNYNIRAQAEGPLEITSLALAFNEMTEELLHLRSYLSNIINSMPSILVGVDKGGMITQWNHMAQQATGVSAENAMGQSLESVFPELSTELEHARNVISSREVYSNPRQDKSNEEQTRYEDVTVFPLITNGVEGAVIRLDDVTERVKIEEIIVQSEKMLSVGGLAAGMAHEINNPLAGVIQTSNVLASRLKQDSSVPANIKAAEELGISIELIEAYMEKRQVPRMLDMIVESSNRMAQIVQNMLSFSRKSEAVFSTHSLEELLEKSLELSASDYDLRKHYDFKLITINKEYSESPVFVPCEESKIEQVLMNILKNGAHAMHGAGTDSPMFTLRTF